MNWKTTAALLGIAAVAGAAPAAAEGELHIFNWGNYTNPELIEKFEKAHEKRATSAASSPLLNSSSYAE
jgi:spermidine/putrescine transport system substrate-binding protein